MNHTLIVAAVHSGVNFYQIAKFIRAYDKEYKNKTKDIHTGYEVIAVGCYKKAQVCRCICGTDNNIKFKSAREASRAAMDFSYVPVSADAKDLVDVIDIIKRSYGAVNGSTTHIIFIDFRRRGAAFPARYADIFCNTIKSAHIDVPFIITRDEDTEWNKKIGQKGSGEYIRPDCSRVCRLLGTTGSFYVNDMNKASILSKMMNYIL